MIVYRIAKGEYANNLSGKGSFLHGGRWNSTGKYALYTSTHRSLALLELLVHIPLNLVSNNDFKILTLETPEFGSTPILASLDNSRNQGDTLLTENKHLYFSVPSIIFPEERNIIINPMHEDFAKIKLIESKALEIDGRLI